MGEQNEVNVEFRLCQAGDDETKYMLFANDSMEIAKQIINVSKKIQVSRTFLHWNCFVN